MGWLDGHCMAGGWSEAGGQRERAGGGGPDVPGIFSLVALFFSSLTTKSHSGHLALSYPHLHPNSRPALPCPALPLPASPGRHTSPPWPPTVPRRPNITQVEFSLRSESTTEVQTSVASLVFGVDVMRIAWRSGDLGTCRPCGRTTRARSNKMDRRRYQHRVWV
ncbi:hypothetical protein E2C01_004015 [Portunus trituberculatus]|uniref:Uncharacterized protein n=1 Tax=Portunus trituberculatus TaxID=210409 RepID=A0A5B7CRQ9_PORTR|nr:hypothetical protein [Portunus trituberculatus]